MYYIYATPLCFSVALHLILPNFGRNLESNLSQFVQLLKTQVGHLTSSSHWTKFVKWFLLKFAQKWITYMFSHKKWENELRMFLHKKCSGNKGELSPYLILKTELEYVFPMFLWKICLKSWSRYICPTEDLKSRKPNFSAKDPWLKQ